ncbi:MAG: acyltransferase [Candidatus Omnitrophica bacterium]|nr:acyltransferase [Candidatus Omnitrophota bacterium]
MGILRLILALGVLLYHSHSPYQMTGGSVSVQIFFIISGFYMSLILDRKYTGPNRYSLFLSNRFLRIFPPYWVVLFITLLISFLSGFRHGQWAALSYYLGYAHFMSAASMAYLIFTNLFLFGQELACFFSLNPESGKVFFSTAHMTGPRLHHFIFLGHAWSLGIELLFYVIAPFIIQRKKFVLFFLLMLSLAVRAYLYGILKWPDEPWTYRFFPSEITLFLLGIISYRIYRTIENKNLPAFLCLLITIMTLTGCLFFQFIIPPGYFFKWLFYTGICLALPFIFQLTKNSKIDAHIAEYSYPVYLVHLLTLRVSKKLIAYWHFENDHFLGMLNSAGLMNILLALAFSFLLIKFISSPIERFRQSRLQTTPPCTDSH